MVMKLKNTEIHKLNPCLREQEQSFKCFSDNGSDKEACQMQIDNYNICKSFWSSVKSDRRRKGIRPYLPPPEERDQIKKEFFEKFYQANK